jgi:hypothetical protein
MVPDARDFGPDASAATPLPMARRHWWSPAPDPVVAPISTRRAYTEVLLVYGAFFLAGVVGAVELLANRYDNPFQNASWSDYLPEIVDVIAQAGLAVAVVLLLSARRGVTAQTLGLTLPRRADGSLAAGQATRILAWAVFAQVLGGVINAALQTGHLPTSTPNAPELIFSVADSIQAGIIEELVVLAFVVISLRQAGRAWWEITVVALVLRGSYHIYYGPGVVGILVWAALFYWIFVRTRSLLLLMACHAGWDTVVFLSQRWPAIAGVALVAAAGIWIAAPITWLVERNDPKQDSAWPRSSPAIGSPRGWPGGLAPPGWQPDPAGIHYWRWWDGQRWTEHVSGP